MKSSVKLIMAAATFVSASFVAIESASAMPLASPEASASSLVQNVGWRCGPGWHVNPWGRCVPNRRWGYGPRYRHWRRW